MATLHLRSASTIADPCPVCDKARVLVGRDGDLGLHGCPAWSLGHEMTPEDEAAHVAIPRTVERPAILAAMAKPPPWLIPYTLGRPAWSYATGECERLLWPALGERRCSGREDGPAATAYFAALDARWERCVERGVLAPGTWVWAPHTLETAQGLVPDGATFVCTCRPDQACHLDRLAPWAERSGWTVVGRREGV